MQFKNIEFPLLEKNVSNEPNPVNILVFSISLKYVGKQKKYTHDF